MLQLSGTLVDYVVLRIFMPLPVEDFNYFFLLTKQRTTCHIFLYDALLISVAILAVFFAIVVGGAESTYLNDTKKPAAEVTTILEKNP